MDYEVRSNSTSGIFAGQNLGTKGDYQVHPKQQGPHEGQRRIMSGETTVAHSLSQNTPFSTPRRDTSSYVSHSRTYPVMLLQRALSVAGRAKTRPSSNPENETPKTKLRTRTVARRRRYARYRTASQGPSNTLQPCTTQTLTVNPSFRNAAATPFVPSGHVSRFTLAYLSQARSAMESVGKRTGCDVCLACCWYREQPCLLALKTTRQEVSKTHGQTRGPLQPA